MARAMFQTKGIHIEENADGTMILHNVATRELLCLSREQWEVVQSYVLLTCGSARVYKELMAALCKADPNFTTVRPCE